MTSSAGQNATATSSNIPAEVEIPGAQVRDYFGSAFAAVEYFARMLSDEGELRGLIGPRELPRLWSRHLINCAAVAELIPPRRNVSVADVGSGAGFPGIVIACMRPEAEVVLIEAMGRRIEWLNDVCVELDLDNVRLIKARSHELPKRVKFDIVTARAVANMTKLTRIAGHLVAGGGKLLALKGRRAPQEVEEAKNALRKAGFTQSTIHTIPNLMDDEPTRIVECVKRS